MAKILAPVQVSIPGHKKAVRLDAILDTGSDFTLLPSVYAKALGLRRKGGVESITMMGKHVSFWFTDLTLHVPGPDCLQETMPVGFATGETWDDEIPYPILGVDFLQRTGGLLDVGRGRHALARGTLFIDRATQGYAASATRRCI